MYILYIDESGDLGSLPVTAGGNDQPVLVIGALIIHADKLGQLTQGFLSLKSKFYPIICGGPLNNLDRMMKEIKGSDVRRDALRGNKQEQRHAIGFIDKIVELIKNSDVKILSRVWVKGLGTPFNGKAVYTSSIQWFYKSFDCFLAHKGAFGFCIADSRDYLQNVNVAHSIFTQKFKPQSEYNKVYELPTFGHSQNHAGIQMCDLICSALLYPIATEVYCSGYINNVHVQPKGKVLRQRFGGKLQNLQYRYRESSGNWNGGIIVSDPFKGRNASHMFK